METLTNKDLFLISACLTEKSKIRQVGLKLGLTAHEINHHLDHSPVATQAAYSMLLSWISRINDRNRAYYKLREAMPEKLTMPHEEQKLQVRISLFGEMILLTITILPLFI